jgi:hypothetical protein
MLSSKKQRLFEMVKRASRRLRFAATTSGLIALGAIVVALAGCGGGGGGGGSTPVYSVNGIVESSTGSPVAGDTVRFDNYSALSATTNSAGKFALQVPAYDVSGADVIYVYDSTGSEVGADTVTTSTISSPVVKLDEASSNTTGSSSSSSSDSPRRRRL